MPRPPAGQAEYFSYNPPRRSVQPPVPPGGHAAAGPGYPAVWPPGNLIANLKPTRWLSLYWWPSCHPLPDIRLA